jgi:hypothetical protein
MISGAILWLAKERFPPQPKRSYEREMDGCITVAMSATPGVYLGHGAGRRSTAPDLPSI